MGREVGREGREGGEMETEREAHRKIQRLDGRD